MREGGWEHAIAHGPPPRRSGFPLPTFAGTGPAGMTYGRGLSILPLPEDGSVPTNAMLVLVSTDIGSEKSHTREEKEHPA